LGVGHEADKLILVNDNVQKQKVRCQSDYRKGPCKQRKDMNLVMWNILSSNRVGSFKTLNNELHKYRVAIAALQEVRWHGSEIFDSSNFTICYSTHCLEQDL
jgi:hypothetical protein